MKAQQAAKMMGKMIESSCFSLWTLQKTAESLSLKRNKCFLSVNSQLLISVIQNQEVGACKQPFKRKRNTGNQGES